MPSPIHRRQHHIAAAMRRNNSSLVVLTPPSDATRPDDNGRATMTATNETTTTATTTAQANNINNLRTSAKQPSHGTERPALPVGSQHKKLTKFAANAIAIASLVFVIVIIQHTYTHQYRL